MTRKKIGLVLLITLVFTLTAVTVWAQQRIQASAQGFKSDITVEVTISGGQIAQVEILSHDDTPFMANRAIEILPEAIITAQSTNVDVVSGATMTSTGILEAVKKALDSAGL